MRRQLQRSILLMLMLLVMMYGLYYSALVEREIAEIRAHVPDTIETIIR